jgi:nucleotide-binding universal stress UspA family protein
MVEFARILFPVDFSGVGEKIIPYVSMMVSCHKAKLDVLHVLEMFPGYTGLVEAHLDVEQLEKSMTHTAEQRLETIVANNFADMEDVDKIVLKGSVGQEIRDYAAQNQIDLIIMASHARKGLNYAFFGSVAHKVSRNSQVPVLLINPSTV